MLINYIVTSGLAIVIIIIYFIAIFDPSADPFGEAARDEVSHAPNVWDTIVLQWIHYLPVQVSRQVFGPKPILSQATKCKMQEVLVKVRLLPRITHSG